MRCSAPARAQVNACSLLGAHGRAVQRTAAALVRSGLAFCLASDGHPGSRDQTVHHGFGALRRTVPPGHAARLTRANPGALLSHGLLTRAPARTLALA